MILKTFITFSIIFLVKANKDTCPKLLRELANEQTLFVYCVTTHSVPVTMCLNCKAHHDSVLHYYDVLAANCSSSYFDMDRINLVASMESVLTGLWTKAYCDDCFNNNNSVTFDEKNKVFNDCLNQNKKDPCDMCKSEYLDLNRFYINLDQHNNGEVCFDLQDSMNRTRNMWSKQLNCCHRDYNVKLFKIALSVTLCLPLLFYITTYFVTKRMERNYEVLNDEELLNNSLAPSTSNRANNTMNNINNPPPTRSNNSNHATTSSSGNNTPSLYTPSKKPNFNVLKEEDSDLSSDDEIAIKTKDKLQ